MTKDVPSVQERLQLSPQQCAELADTRRAMLSNVGALRTEREQLRAQAQVRLSTQVLLPQP